MADVDVARRALEDALGPERVLSDPLALRLYARDASMVEGGCALVVFPQTADEIVACVRIAGAHGLPVVPRGSGTGLAGGSTPIGDALVGDVLGQPIAAQQVDIAPPAVDAGHDGPGLGTADGAREDVRPARGGGLRPAEHAPVDQVLGHRLITRDLHEPPIAHDVRPAGVRELCRARE